jgi:hypothetical protein
MKKILYVLIAILLLNAAIFVAEYYFFSKNTIKIYYYNSSLDQGPGGAQCSKNGLVAVERVLPKSDKQLEDGINLLINGQISDEEKNKGLSSEFPLSGFVLKSAATRSGTTTLTFDDPENNSSGGACRAGILWHQIEATAKQFPGITSVEFMPKDLFQP